MIHNINKLNASPEPNRVIISVPFGTQTITDDVIRSDNTQLIKLGPGTLVLNLPNSHQYGTVVEQGTVVVKHRSALGASLDVKDGGRVFIDVGPINWYNNTNYILLSNLNLGPEGNIDMFISQMRVAIGGYNIANIKNSLVSGRNNGGWDGKFGVVSRMAKANNRLYGIGYRIMPATQELRIGFAAYGDVNLDGTVNSTDISIINNAGKYNLANDPNVSWADGDFNYSGGFNSADVSMINNAGFFGLGPYMPSFPPTPSGSSGQGIGIGEI